MTTITETEWFKSDGVRAVFACLNRDGFEARVVGGAVRNMLLGVPVSDIDFATTATPEDTMRLAATAGLKTVATGMAHGTVTLLVNGASFEVTTLRRDVETDGRHALVQFGTSWEADARRRDFTMNALYVSFDGALHDPLNGLPDLYARKVRFIGDATARIREDYLRILRFFRFSAFYGEGDFDSEGIAASIRERLGLLRLSRERIRSELLKILVSPRATDVTRALDHTGLLLLLLGCVVRRERFERVCGIEAKLGRDADPIVRLAALATFVDEDASRLSDRLRLSTAETTRMSSVIKAARKLAGPGNIAVGPLLYDVGPEVFEGAVILAWADSGDEAREPLWLDAINVACRWTYPRFPVSGADLLANGFVAGPAMGKALKELETLWVNADFSYDKEALLALLKKQS